MEDKTNQSASPSYVPSQAEVSSAPPPQQQIPSSPPKSLLKIFLAAFLFVLFGLGILGYFLVNKGDFKTQQKVTPQQKQQTQVLINNPLGNPNSLQNDQYEPSDDVVCARFTNLKKAIEFVDQACVLDLSGQNLTKVPEEVYSLNKLNDIDLSNNNLTEFPPRLLSMERLISIDLSNNKISTLPTTGVKKVESNDPNQPTNQIQRLLLKGNPLSNDVISKNEINPQ